MTPISSVMQRSRSGPSKLDAVVEIVFRLQHLVARQLLLARHLERGLELAGVEIGAADVADLAPSISFS